eukprot:4093551-Pyramimonas_sp.AAC.1
MSMPPSRMRKTAKDVVAVAIPNMPYVYIIMHMYIVSPTTAYLVRIGTEHEKLGFKKSDNSRMGYSEVERLLLGLRD